MTAEEILKKHLDGWWKAQIGHHPHIENVLEAMKEYAKLKCEELLKIVVENVKTENIYPKYVLNEFDEFEHIIVNKESILNAVDLDEFIK